MIYKSCDKRVGQTEMWFQGDNLGGLLYEKMFYFTPK